MTTFGFSAFLKLICLNDRPQLTEIRHRVFGRGEGGYDYHASMRRLATSLLRHEISFEQAILEANRIQKAPERASAVRALEAVNSWVAGRSAGLQFPPATYTSPSNNFKIKFTADCGLVIEGRKTAIHLWNTKSPRLYENLTLMALSLAQEAFSDQDDHPDDVGVLNLRNMDLILLSSSSLPIRGDALAGRIDRLFEIVEGEQDRRDDRPQDRPGAPPPN